MTQIRRDWPHQGQLVRFNIGLEEVQDLINDLTQAFKSFAPDKTASGVVDGASPTATKTN
jgi:hypothetical protein